MQYSRAEEVRQHDEITSLETRWSIEISVQKCAIFHSVLWDDEAGLAFHSCERSEFNHSLFQ